MENPLSEAHEEIKHLEHVSASRLKVVLTISILIVTMLTTLAGVMAAIWSAKESASQRARQQSTADSLKSSLEATAQQSTSDQAIDDSTEALWRSAFLNVDSLQVTDTSLKTALQTQAKSALTVQKTIAASLPKGANGSSYVAGLRKPALVSAELAKADAQASVGWLGKNNSALAVVTTLALSLFLLGLALTISSRAVQIGFTALAIVMTVIAGARLAQIAAESIVLPSDSCIARYGDAVTAANSGDMTGATKTLDAVVGDCTSFADAWTALGQVRFDASSAKARTGTQQAFQEALDVSDAKSASLYNNIGYIETVNKDYADADRNLTVAGELAPENPVVLASRAELAAARGDSTGAHKFLDEALDIVATHGPYFRDQFFFAALRTDERDFTSAGITGRSISDFFLEGREAEASIGALGSITPGDTHGAHITGLILKTSDTELGRVAKFVTIGFTYSDLAVGDHISLRFYANGVTYDPIASIPDTVVSSNSTLVGSGVEQPDSHFRLGLSNTGETTMEVYLNGVSQGEVSINVPPN
jgi:tetratricopeptide (TPR) repeat protein